MVTQEMERYDCVRFILAVSFMTQLYLKKIIWGQSEDMPWIFRKALQLLYRVVIRSESTSKEKKIRIRG